jgi:polysaccharide transporter, PST family
LATPVVTMLFGDQWLAAAPVLAILAIGGIFRSLLQVCFWIYTSQGLTRAQLKFYLVAQPVLVVVILCGLPWGIVGVAIGHSIGYLLYWVASIWWVGRISGLQVAPLVLDAARALLLFAAPVGLAAFLAAHWVDGIFAQLALGTVAAAAVGALLCAVIRPVGADIRVLVRLARTGLAGRR